VPSVMEPAERYFWVMLGLWGSAAVTIFGAGLFALFEEHPWFGSFYTSIGTAGVIFVSLHLTGKITKETLGSIKAINVTLIAALLLTWIFFGYAIWYSPKAIPPINPLIKMSILSVVFPQTQPSELVVAVHLANPGAPSTVKDCRLIVRDGDDILAQFPPRELSTAPTLGPDLGVGGGRGPSVQRGRYLSKEPLGQGEEIDASITYTVTGEVMTKIQKAGTMFKLTARDVAGRPIDDEYKIP
jgi:hypothetical protein